MTKFQKCATQKSVKAFCSCINLKGESGTPVIETVYFFECNPYLELVWMVSFVMIFNFFFLRKYILYKSTVILRMGWPTRPPGEGQGGWGNQGDPAKCWHNINAQNRRTNYHSRTTSSWGLKLLIKSDNLIPFILGSERYSICCRLCMANEIQSPFAERKQFYPDLSKLSAGVCLST